MLRYIFSDFRNDFPKILKPCLLFVLAVLAGCLLPSLFSADTKALAGDISGQLLAGIQGKSQLNRICFWGEFLPYGLLVLVLWLSGGGRFGIIPATATLLGFGLLWGIGINLVFSMGFAYGILVFLICMLPGNLLIAAAFVLIIIIILRQDHNYLRYSYDFLVPLVMVFAACWYLVFAGPHLLNLVIKLI